MDMLPSNVKVVEVGPRDGLQNEKQHVSLAAKLQLVTDLEYAGVRYIETGSFVNPKWVPAMADSDLLFKQLTYKPNTTYSALVPNMQGLHRAIDSGATEIAIFTAASETFNQKNINCSIDESIERYETLISSAQDLGLRVRGYISCVSGCPYEGHVDPSIVSTISEKLIKLGCYEVSLGDTIGVATPLDFTAMIQKVIENTPIDAVAVHCHDTYGQALANIYAALSLGVQIVDSSVGGLGGCPYAKGSTGNIATEDLIYMLDGLNINSGIDLNKLILAGNNICAHLGRDNASKAAHAITNI